MISDSDIGPPYFVETTHDPAPYKEHYHHQSITSHIDPFYRKRCFEELRLLEYDAGRYTPIHSSAASSGCSAFGSLPVAGPVHGRNSIRASRDDTRRYVIVSSIIIPETIC
jgi:hypothetical protein